mgnify:CR=1 FL=1
MKKITNTTKVLRFVKKNPKAKAKMENGTFAHDRIQSRLSKMNDSYKVIAHEIDTNLQDPPIHGYQDSLIHDIENDLMLPFEIKTAEDSQIGRAHV